jgi:hypothetical protein
MRATRFNRVLAWLFAASVTAAVLAFVRWLLGEWGIP